MLNLAAKLKRSPKNSAATSKSSSAIFGGISATSRLPSYEHAKLRIGLWPIQSETEPLVAMGIGALLAILLERWTSVQVYRLAAKIEGDPHDYQWSSEKSQFGVDDWELDGLDENAAIWGTFTPNQPGYTLTLEAENDLTDDEGKTQTWEFETLTELINALPQIAEIFAGYWRAGESDSMAPLFQKTQWGEDSLRQALHALFNWELKLFLNLWGKDWSDGQILADYLDLAKANEALNAGLGDWIVANAVARVLSPNYALLASNKDLLKYVEKASLDVNAGLIYRYTIALVLYSAGYPVRAYDLLELNVEQFPENVASWLTLAELYWESGEVGTALNAIQRAIQLGTISEDLYRQYAEMLLTLDAGNLILNPGTERTSSTGRTYIEGFVLIDTNDIKVNRLIHEAIAAYKAVLSIAPNNVETISYLLIQMIDVKEPNLWPRFERLVELDVDGIHVQNVIQAMSSLEDIEPAIKILFGQVKRNPSQVPAHLNLASAYIMNDEQSEAFDVLEAVQKLNNTKQLNAEIEKMLLVIDDPDFDTHLAEITDLLNAGNEITPDDVEFLELTVENAPTFAPGYILLATAYLNWDETSDALDTLLDGQGRLPDDPDIATLLSRVLWQEGEAQLAFDCLNKSLAQNPDHVPTLATIGRFLFEDGQEDEARSFLARAEAIDPRNAALTATRIYIANMMND